jgi:CheY-like chemotaxis protein
MNENRHILWADDEIEFLKPHILYLENKGYTVTAVNSGEDAIHICNETSIDLVLLDEMMTGLDGLTTLKHIKDDQPDIPIIMITKNEEEWLMEEAIAAQITNYLTKPVNPSQILMACKNALEHQQIQRDRAAQNYLQDFQKIGEDIASASTADDWLHISDSLSEWSITFDKLGDQGLGQVLEDQIQEANGKFTQFIVDNYQSWINSDSRPVLSQDITQKFIAPLLEKDEKVVLVVIDCLRADQWKAMQSQLFPFFRIDTQYHYSILPTATPFSRNSIFSGLLPSEVKTSYPDLWDKMMQDETSMNRHEDLFMKDQLKRLGFEHKSSHYSKIIGFQDGDKLESTISDYKHIDLLSIVVNFVDMLGHSRSESNVLKEMVPDESAYRHAVCSWMENAWLKNVLEEISTWGHTVVITSDHGSIRVNKPIQVRADKQASTGVRYKFGRNLKVPQKTAFTVLQPEEFGLARLDLNTEYIIAKGGHYFVYPNQFHKFANRFNNSFQHGGISMDEMIVPVAILKGKQ